MKTKTILTGLFALIFLSFLVSAGAVCGTSTELCASVVSSPSTVSPGSEALITFNVTYEGSADSTNLRFSESTTTKGTWSGLPADNSLSINKLETKSISGRIVVPSTANGAINSVIKVRTSSGNSVDLTVPVISITSSSNIRLTKTGDITASENGTLKIENIGNTQLSNVVLSNTGTLVISYSSNNLQISPGESRTVTLTLDNPAELSFGSNTITIEAEDIATNTKSSIQYNTQKTFCRVGEKGGNLSISDVEINNEGSGEDDEWNLLDEITIEVTIDNDGNDDVDDIMVQLGFFDSNGKNIADELDFLDSGDDEEIDLGRLRDGDEETVTFNFKVPADFDDGNYKLAIKAFSDDLGEANECTDRASDLSDSTFESISVDRETDSGKFIDFDEVVLNPSQATCGDNIELEFDISNIGDEDQDQVKVNLVGRELSVDLSQEIRSNLDQGDSESLRFSFRIPDNAKDGNYVLRINAEYDYRNGDYRESSEEDETVSLRVVGCSATSNGNGTTGRIASINAALDSRAIAGQDMIVKATITNLATQEATLIISATDFEDWAELNSISQRIITLLPGETKEVTVNLKIKSGTSGEQTFKLEARSGESVESREVIVEDIEGSQGFSFDFGGNSLIWIIGAINVILIIFIIVVAVRISRK